MKGLKIIIIIFIITVIIIGITLGIILIRTKDNGQDEIALEQSFNIANKLTKIDSRQEYFNVKSCMDNYKKYSLDLYYLLEEESTTKQTSKEPFAERYREELLYIVPKFVKEELDLNTNNVYEKIGLPDKQIRIDNIYKSIQTVNTEAYENETDIHAYFVESTLINIDTKEQEKNSTIIIIDMNTSTFCIIPEEYIKQKNISIQEGEQLNIYQQKVIPKNNYNGFKYTPKNNIDMAVEYLSNMKTNFRYDEKQAYDRLDEEYKNAHFEDLEDFKKYISNNKDTLLKAVATKYQVTTTDDYTQYVIIDQDGNYYIFRETAVMEYSVILDTYTIDLPEFIEKYNSANEQQKVALNINKFMNAINKKDYKYAYSKLASGFKQNYFKTQEEFEKYAKENFFENNKITFDKFGNQATIYTYTTTLTNKETNQAKKQNFVVSLGEGTEFEMSFEI